MAKDVDEDPFWDLALSNAKELLIDPDEQSEEGDPLHGTGHRWKTYNLPQLNESARHVSLKLAALPPTDGIWSPLGADAWYGSALLTALLFDSFALSTTENSLNAFRQLFDKLQSTNSQSIRVLELGSGAVGLSGFAMASLLQLQSEQRVVEQDDSEHQKLKHQVLLTDNDPDVLKQLKLNFKRNIAHYETSVKVTVCALDWSAHSLQNSIFQEGETIDLVIGAELVYSDDTAKACSACVQTLLRQFPDLLVFIVQIIDRPGWENFLNDLRHEGFHVRERAIPLHYHHVAMQMIQMGGTLDHFDYGSCFISNPKNTLHT